MITSTVVRFWTLKSIYNTADGPISGHKSNKFVPN